MKNPIKIDDLGVPLFLETPIWVVMLFKGLRLQNGPSKRPHSTANSSTLRAPWLWIEKAPRRCKHNQPCTNGFFRFERKGWAW